jgi:hypothetical protein
VFPKKRRPHRGTPRTSNEERVKLQAFLAATADAAEDAFDAAYPPERLSAERTRILQCLARPPGQRAAQIIRFPGSRMSHKQRPRRRRYRWLSGAAAAGLTVGILLGQQLHRQRESPPAPTAIDIVSTVARSSPATSESLSSTSDEVFMAELESMLRTPQVDGLSVLDAISPRAREVAVNLW